MPAQPVPTPTAAPAAQSISPAARPAPVPAPSAANPELGTRPQRRHFSAKDKLRILTEADHASASGEPGAIGAILRREGIYSSMLSAWRRQRDQGALTALAPHKRGPVPDPVNPLDGEVTRLRRENAGLIARLSRAEQIIDIQKKLSEMLAIPLPSLTDRETV